MPERKGTRLDVRSGSSHLRLRVLFRKSVRHLAEAFDCRWTSSFKAASPEDFLSSYKDIFLSHRRRGGSLGKQKKLSTCDRHLSVTSRRSAHSHCRTDKQNLLHSPHQACRADWVAQKAQTDQFLL
jgi:hypothetical protein